jgi:hypothetical protein
MAQICDRVILKRLRIVGVIVAVLMFAFLYYIALLYVSPNVTAAK